MPNEILRGLADNPALFDAVKKTLEAEFEVKGILDVSKDDSELGQIVRARLEGLRALENGFKKISQHKTFKEGGVGINPAR